MLYWKFVDTGLLFIFRSYNMGTSQKFIKTSLLILVLLLANNVIASEQSPDEHPTSWSQRFYSFGSGTLMGAKSYVKSLFSSAEALDPKIAPKVSLTPLQPDLPQQPTFTTRAKNVARGIFDVVESVTPYALMFTMENP